MATERDNTGYTPPVEHDPWCMCIYCRKRDDERVARAFHEAYERLAPDHGYETRKDSAVPWKDVPAKNRALMRAVVADLIERRVIRT